MEFGCHFDEFLGREGLGTFDWQAKGTIVSIKIMTRAGRIVWDKGG